MGNQAGFVYLHGLCSPEDGQIRQLGKALLTTQRKLILFEKILIRTLVGKRIVEESFLENTRAESNTRNQSSNG